MKRDLPDTDLIDALVFWWRYESGWLPVEGYPSECPSTAGYRTSRQHDTDNGAFETDQRGQFAKRIAEAVNRVPQPERMALYFVARNRACGVQVWKSPRLPADDVDRAKVVAEALELFARELGM